MTKIDELMALAEDYAQECKDFGHISDSLPKLALQSALEAALKPDDAYEDARVELACAEDVLDGIACGLLMQDTAFDCIGDYIKAVVDALKPGELLGYSRAIESAARKQWANHSGVNDE